MMKHLAHNRQNEGGFVLISLAILLIVIGLAISAYLYTAQIRKERELKQKTEFAYASVMNKMANYLAKEGHLPCPAARNLAPTAALYGTETNCSSTAVGSGSCGQGYCVASNAGLRIRIGIVPFATLKIDAKDAVDAYGNFFTYAVTERQATSSYVADNGGAIQYSYIQDKELISDPDVTVSSANTNFVLVSHGPDGAGSFRMNGQANLTACLAVGIDRENCDNDGVFISRNFAPADGAAHFDDQVEAFLLDWVYIWDSSYGDYDSSYSRGGLDSNMGVGTDNPQARLHVGDGGNLRIEDGRLDTQELCDEDGDHCFNPNKLGGDIAQNEGMKCGTNRVMIDIRNGNPVCGTFSSPEPSACPNNSFFTGLSYATGGRVQVNCRNAYNGTTTQMPLN